MVFTLLKLKKKLAAPTQKKRFTNKFASSRQSPRPRRSAFGNEEFEECSVLVLGFVRVERVSVVKTKLVGLTRF